MDDINITPSTTLADETDSFIYNPSFASSETSIASYKTERTINSRKSRYNALPRHKYAGIRPQNGFVSLGVDAVKAVSGQRPSGELPHVDHDAIPSQAAAQNSILIKILSDSEATAKTRLQLGTELKPKFATLVEYMYQFNTSKASASTIHNTRRAQELLSNRNFIYPEARTGRDPYRHPIIQRAIDTTWFRDKDDIGVMDHERFSPMPIPIIAITLTVIEWCIGEWSGGTRRDSNWDDAKFQTVYDSHVSSLLEFPALGPASLYRLQCDLLLNARDHAGVDCTNDPPITKDEIVTEDQLQVSATESESKGGIPKYLRAREYRKAAKETLKFVKTVSDRARVGQNSSFLRHNTVAVQRPSGVVPHADAAPLKATMQNPTLMDRKDGDFRDPLKLNLDLRKKVEDVPGVDDAEDDEIRQIFLRGGTGIPIGPDGVPRPLLPPIAPQHVGRKCLVLDLDETLVHSTFKVENADYVVPVEVESQWHNVYVNKRPGVDNFLKKMGEIYEIVVFTASLGKYVNPALDKLDVYQVIAHRLFRESCSYYREKYVKDLSHLGRPLADTIILDNSPASYIFHPNNAVPVSTWFNDAHDTDLTDLCLFLTDLSAVDDVRAVLDGGL